MSVKFQVTRPFLDGLLALYTSFIEFFSDFRWKNIADISRSEMNTSAYVSNIFQRKSPWRLLLLETTYRLNFWLV